MARKRPITTEEATPSEVRDALRPLRNAFSVALMSPGNAFAVGAVIRVAHNFLAREIVVVGGSPFYAKAAMGMDKYEDIVRLADVDAFLEHVRDRPLWVAEKDHARRSIHSVEAFPPEVVFVFGSERFGVPDSIVDRADDVVGIPIYGVNHSLPVAVAAGIVMAEWARRRYREGTVV
jgi:tRNA G18 (ribose-2'-O)-methylase SpoU